MKWTCVGLGLVWMSINSQKKEDEYKILKSTKKNFSLIQYNLENLLTKNGSLSDFIFTLEKETIYELKTWYFIWTPIKKRRRWVSKHVRLSLLAITSH